MLKYRSDLATFIKFNFLLHFFRQGKTIKLSRVDHQFNLICKEKQRKKKIRPIFPLKVDLNLISLYNRSSNGPCLIAQQIFARIKNKL